MTKSSLVSQQKSDTFSQDLHSSCILHVCTSCRPQGKPRDPKENRDGFIFYQQVRDAINQTSLRGQVEVRPAECLSVCPRPCGISLSLAGSWTYLFGDQRPSETVNDVVKCVSLYINSEDGLMARKQRPKSLRGSILGRIPPVGGDNQCT